MVYVPIKCPICKSKNVKNHGKDPKGKQKYMCKNPDCSKKVFLDEYTYKGYLPENKLKIIEMTLNEIGIRDTARVLEISPNTVLSELKKRTSDSKS